MFSWLGSSISVEAGILGISIDQNRQTGQVLWRRSLVILACQDWQIPRYGSWLWHIFRFGFGSWFGYWGMNWTWVGVVAVVVITIAFVVGRSRIRIRITGVYLCDSGVAWTWCVWWSFGQIVISMTEWQVLDWLRGILLPSCHDWWCQSRRLVTGCRMGVDHVELLSLVVLKYC